MARWSTGANMENACYRLGLCAEQSALTAAQHAFGLDKVARIAVAGGRAAGGDLSGELTCTPCGGCRQAIYEASCLSGIDIEILSLKWRGDVRGATPNRRAHSPRLRAGELGGRRLTEGCSSTSSWRSRFKSESSSPSGTGGLERRSLRRGRFRGKLHRPNIDGSNISVPACAPTCPGGAASTRKFGPTPDPWLDWIVPLATVILIALVATRLGRRAT